MIGWPSRFLDQLKSQRLRAFHMHAFSPMKRLALAIFYIIVALFLVVTAVSSGFSNDWPTAIISAALALILTRTLNEELFLPHSDIVDSFMEREDLYLRAASVMLSRMRNTEGRKEFCIALLHSGRPGQPRTERDPAKDFSFRQFQDAIRELMRMEAWTVKVVWNIDSKAALVRALNVIKETQIAPNFDMRVFIPGKRAPSPEIWLPHLSPLIIGDRDAFLAIDDHSYTGVRAGIHVQGQESVEIIKDYFNDIWQNERLIVLRAGRDIYEDNIEKVMRQVDR